MISVVLITRNEGDWLVRTVRQLADTLPANSEIMVVDDGSTDGSCRRLPADPRIRVVRGTGHGVARARNLGARRARGNVLVFADAHLQVKKDWWKPLVSRALRPGVGGVAPAISDVRKGGYRHGLRFGAPNLEIDWLRRREWKPHQAPLIPWCCTAMSRTVFEATGGFDEGMLGLGYNDNEIGVRLWSLGYELWVVPSVVVGHLFRRNNQPYPLESWKPLHNRFRLAFVHFEEPRIGQVLHAWRNDRDFGRAVSAIALGDVARRRRAVAARRLHDSEWYFRRFGDPFPR